MTRGTLLANARKAARNGKPGEVLGLLEKAKEAGYEIPERTKERLYRALPESFTRNLRRVSVSSRL